DRIEFGNADFTGDDVVAQIALQVGRRRGTPGRKPKGGFQRFLELADNARRRVKCARPRVPCRVVQRRLYVIVAEKHLRGRARRQLLKQLREFRVSAAETKSD